MEKINCIGSGNSSLGKNYKAKMLFLNNEELKFNDVKLFLEQNKIPKFPIILSNRKTKNILGSCFPSKQKVILYRHSVAVFLHELAHLINYANYIKCHFDYKPHGKEFVFVLEKLIDSWTRIFK
jgi:hypothetical protein